MIQTPYDNQTLRRYLLGTASEAETARLDELSLTDDDCALALAQAENELVDAWASANLTATEHSQFERHYLSSPLRREKAHFAQELRRFRQQSATSSNTVAPPAASGRTFWRSWFQLTPLWQAGLATATMLLLLACGWLVIENRRLQQQAAAERAALAQREADLKAAAAQSQEELARLRDKLTVPITPSPMPAPAPAPLPVAPAAQLFTFSLAAPLRGADELPQISLPATAAMIAVRLELETNDYPRYRAALRDPLTNRVVWQSAKLAAVRKTITLRLPRRLLAAQRYAFELFGVTANNTKEPLSNYPFKVIRR